MQLSRKQLKTLRTAARSGDAGAAASLLAHSVALGHVRLSLRRYFSARALDAPDIARFSSFCGAAARRVEFSELVAMAHEAAQRLAHSSKVHQMVAELLPPIVPILLPYEGIMPRFETAPQVCGQGAAVLGKVQIGAGASIGAMAVIRGDGHFIRIGDNFYLGGGSTVHIAHKLYPTIIGDQVTVGRNAVVHACTVGTHCTIEDEVVVLDGTIIGENVLVEAGSTVFPRSVLASGFAYAGSPARQVRPLLNDEVSERASRLREAATAGFSLLGSMPKAPSQQGTTRRFVAPTARLAGNVVLGPRSSIFFSCDLDAGDASIVVGQCTNIQDNTHIKCTKGGVGIGQDSTIGHNVMIADCQIGARTLVGMGSVINNGTIIEDDVFVAAGTITEVGQKLERGWLWGGRPARPLAKLDSKKRAIIVATVEQYCTYARAYQEAKSQVRRGGRNGTSSFTNRDPNGRSRTNRPGLGSQSREG